MSGLIYRQKSPLKVMHIAEIFQCAIMNGAT
jgi:hypothetical protein